MTALNTQSVRMTRTTTALAGAAASALILSACAGGVNASSSAGEGEGFAYGATQEEVNEAIADLGPVKLKFQPASASPTSNLAGSALQMKELVEERSNGQIEIEMIWGQAIADYSTVADALSDGRLDLAYVLPTYLPSEFPAFNDLARTTGMLPGSPFTGELLSYATYNDIGWNTPGIVESFEEMDIRPLTPFSMTSATYSICSKVLDSASEWQGLSVSASNSGQFEQLQDIGASAVSMEYTEVFEALQRGTVDCNIGSTGATVESGILEFASNVGYTTEASFSRSAGAFLAGQSFAELPLAYQQILFDSNQLSVDEVVKGLSAATVGMIGAAKEYGGTVTEVDADTQAALLEVATAQANASASEGRIDEDIVGTLDETIPRWDERIKDLGYEDEGGMDTFDEWFDDSRDFMDFAEDLYENSSAMDHRPE